jgi:hypothetical protein
MERVRLKEYWRQVGGITTRVIFADDTLARFPTHNQHKLSVPYLALIYLAYTLIVTTACLGLHYS